MVILLISCFLGEKNVFCLGTILPGVANVWNHPYVTLQTLSFPPQKIKHVEVASQDVAIVCQKMMKLFYSTIMFVGKKRAKTTCGFFVKNTVNTVQHTHCNGKISVKGFKKKQNSNKIETLGEN